jgi:putative aminopeptidase FrvX
LTNLPINLDAITDFLVRLLNIPSPTGYHLEAVAYIRQAFERLNIPNLVISETLKGALVLTWKGQSSTAPQAVTAHLDTLGLMVKEIKSSGRIKATEIGGIMWTGIELENVTLRTHDNRRYRGTVMLNNPAAHVNKKATITERNADTMEIRLDARTTSADETRALGVEIGDFIFLDPRVEVTDTGFIRSRFLDNKAGVAVIYGAIKALHETGLQPAQDTTFLISNYEEVGHGGAAGFPENIHEMLCIDMAAIGDGQTSDEFSVTICVKDSSGPYHFDFNNKLRRIVSQLDIPAKIDIYPYYGSDGSAYWRAGGQARVALIGPGVSASHSYERTHKDSLHHSTHLLAGYLLDNA